MRVKVVCKKRREKVGKELTVGKIYEYDDISALVYIYVDGEAFCFYKERIRFFPYFYDYFTTVEEWRDKKLNDLGI